MVPNKDLAIFMNEIKVYDPEIQGLMRISKYGLRFLTEKECSLIKMYSMHRWTRQGVSLDRVAYTQLMKNTIATDDEAIVDQLLKTSPLRMNWQARSTILGFFLIPLLADLYLTSLPDEERVAAAT